MPQYIYEAVDQAGQRVSGEVAADNVSQAVNSLESLGLSVLSIAASNHATIAAKANVTAWQPSALGPNDSSLDGHFDAIIERRDTLVPALQALANELPAGRPKREITQLIDELSKAQNGTELRRSKHAIRWLPLLASSLSSDTRSGRFSDLIAYAARDLQNRSERRAFIAYPIIVMVTALVVLGLLCLLVVPTFDNMFSDFGLQLPAPTTLLVQLTRGLHEHPFGMLLTIAGVFAAFYGVVRLWTHFALTTRLFGFAVAGNSSSVCAMSTLTGQLAELLQVGLSVPDAIWIAGNGCENYHFKKAAEQLARDAYSQAKPLCQSRVAGTFPANVIHALDGCDGHPNIGLLRELSAIYSQRVNRRVDWSTGAMVQISIVLLGAAIAFLVLALFMPLVSLITSLT